MTKEQRNGLWTQIRVAVNRLITEAVEAEREACAKLAEKWAEDPDMDSQYLATIIRGQEDPDALT